MTTVCTYSAPTGDEILPGERWAQAFVSTELDDRGAAAVAWVRARSNAVETLLYDAQRTEMMSSAGTMTSLQLKANILGATSILLEATTMGVAELSLTLKAARIAGVKSIDLLYLEPLEYAKETMVQWGRDFSLSGARSFSGIKGLSLDMSMHPKGTVVAFLGYEGARLRAALEQVTVDAWDRYAVFGVPGFEPGWEINALANNIGFVADRQMNLRFCAAASVSAAYRLLDELRRREGPDDPILILPLGTKPHSIASSIFVCDHSQFQLAGLSYDHPERSKKRSSDVREWHLYRVVFA